MKISIITVSYNSVDTIEQTISSVINQTYSDIEYIIIDGKSTDGTVDIIRKYANKISYWVSEPDNGIYDAMNKGIQVSTGDYIQIIGSDDCLCSSDIIRQVAEQMDGHPEIFSAARYEVDEDRKIQILATNETARNFSFGVLPWMPHSSVFVSSEYMKAHLFDISYRIAADYKFLLEAYMDKFVRIQYSNLPVVYFSRGGISNNSNSRVIAENNRLMVELSLQDKFGITACPLPRANRIKSFIKSMLNRVGLLPFVLCNLGKWQPHYCNNKICRWCGRKV